jgi:hypothetical protein
MGENVFSVKVYVTILIACIFGSFVWIPTEPPLPVRIAQYAQLL